ncbi:hypothetical protein ACTPGW_002607 [Enterococcus faecalis]
MKKIVRFGLMMLLLFVVAGCKSEKTKEESKKSTESTQNEMLTNEENAKRVVEVLEKEQPKFKITIDEEANVSVVEIAEIVYFHNNSKYGDSAVYFGYDDTEKGTSLYSFSSEQNLSLEQLIAISRLSSGKDTETIDSSMVNSIYKLFPETFAGGRYPYRGTDFKYVTLSNLKIKDSEKNKGMKKIVGETTIHITKYDGTELTKTFPTEYEPKIGNTPLDENEVNEALNAEVMNETIPDEGRGANVYSNNTPPSN